MPNTRNPATPRLLITAGPTQEPIDAVRYLGNRSSGRLGIALASAAADRGWDVTLLLGPTPRRCEDSRVRTLRFRTTADLADLLKAHFPAADALVMAAAVADYRPVVRAAPGSTDLPPFDPSTDKLTRNGRKLVLDLEPTPDLLAECAQSRAPHQVIVGFALEPRERLIDSARTKLQRKRIDLIVANPLETMDGETIEAVLLAPTGAATPTPGAMTKGTFAPWLLAHIDAARATHSAPAATPRRA